MKSDQITIVCFIKSKPQSRETVRTELLNLAKMTRTEKGNVNYELHVSDSDDSSFIIYENWKDQPALDYHMNQPYLKDFLAKQEELLEMPVEAKLCKIVA